MDAVAASEDAPTDDLDRFVRCHYRRLIGLLILREGGEAAAEDVAHESLLKLVKHWDRVRVMENPWAWLAKVAVNQSRSRWRRGAMADRVERRLAPSGNAVSGEEQLTELLLVVGRLPHRQRTALLLRHYAQLSVRETAQAMGCAEGTVKSLTSRAVECLRAELGEEIHDEGD